MKKSVKVDLSWRVWSLVVGFFILIGFIGISFASLGSVPNMGHSVNDLQKCGANETLKMDSAGISWICQASSASPANADYVIESGASADGSSWYRKYNSGWIEQGGKSSGDGTVTYLHPFTGLPRYVTATASFTGTYYQYTLAVNAIPTTTTMDIHYIGNTWGSPGTFLGIYWEAKGY